MSGNGEEPRSGGAGEDRPRRKIGSTLSAIIGVIWAVLSAVMLLMPLSQGPLSARLASAALIVASILLALPWSVRWLRRRMAFMRPTFVPPLLAWFALAAGVMIIAPHIDPYQGMTPEERAAAQTEAQERREASEREREARAARRDAEARDQDAQGDADQQDRAAQETERARGREQERVSGEITAMWREIVGHTQPCDQAAQTVGTVLGARRPDPVQSYTAVNRARSVCSRAGLQVLTVDAPRSLSGSERRAFDEAIRGCGAAYAGKGVMFDQMRDVVDGDIRPSRVAAVQRAGEAANAEVLRCVTQLHTLASRHGVTLGDASSE